MISVIIPAYNEEKAIGKTIDQIIHYFQKHKEFKGSEIIVVNDGSTDKTYDEIIKRDVIVVDNGCNKGYGYSLKKGIEKAKHEMIAIIDADMTYPFSSIKDLVKKKEEGYDLVVSKRVGIHLQESFFRRLLRKIIIKYIEFITGEKVKDINSGFRVFDKSTVTPFFPQLCNTFSFTTTQTLAYIMNSYRVGYVDIKYHERIGKSKVKFFKDSFIMLRHILEACVYYNPLKVFGLFSIICFLLSLVCFILSYSMNLFVFYILGIVNLILTVLVFGIGLLGVFLKQMNIQK